MTDDETRSEDDASDGPSDWLGLIASELRRLHAARATGDLAALRRMSPKAPPPTAFYRLLARAGVPSLSATTVPDWSAATGVMAQRPDALKGSRDLGGALARIGLSEQRLDTLLAARGDTLRDLARRTSLRLARSEEAMPYRELCQLTLFAHAAEHPAGDVLRIRIAQSFQRARQTER